MTAGHGVCHSEVSTDRVASCTASSCWTALLLEHMDVAPKFEHYVPEPVEVGGARVSLFLGSLDLPGTSSASSPVRTYTPLLGLQILLAPGAELVLDLDTAFEHDVLLDRGTLSVNDGCTIGRSHLLHEAPGPRSMTRRAGEAGADLILLVGPPFGEEIVMWWNFVGRSHDDVVTARQQGQAEPGHDLEGRFGAFDYPGGVSLPAPGLPPVRLRPSG